MNRKVNVDLDRGVRGADLAPGLGGQTTEASMAKRGRRAAGGTRPAYVLIDRKTAVNLAATVADLQVAVLQLVNLVNETRSAWDAHAALVQTARQLLEPLGDMIDDLQGENELRRQRAQKAHRTRQRRQAAEPRPHPGEWDAYDVPSVPVEVTGPMELPGPTIDLTGDQPKGAAHD